MAGANLSIVASSAWQSSAGPTAFDPSERVHNVGHDDGYQWTVHARGTPSFEIKTLSVKKGPSPRMMTAACIERSEDILREIEAQRRLICEPDSYHFTTWIATDVVYGKRGRIRVGLHNAWSHVCDRRECIGSQAIDAVQPTMPSICPCMASICKSIALLMVEALRHAPEIDYRVQCSLQEVVITCLDADRADRLTACRSAVIALLTMVSIASQDIRQCLGRAIWDLREDTEWTTAVRKK